MVKTQSVVLQDFSTSMSRNYFLASGKHSAAEGYRYELYFLLKPSCTCFAFVADVTINMISGSDINMLLSCES